MAAIISIEMPWMRSELSVMVVGFCKYRVLWDKLFDKMNEVEVKLLTL